MESSLISPHLHRYGVEKKDQFVVGVSMSSHQTRASCSSLRLKIDGVWVEASAQTVEGGDPKVQRVFMGDASKEWGSIGAGGSGRVEEVLDGFLLALIEGRHTLRPQTCRHLQRRKRETANEQQESSPHCWSWQLEKDLHINQTTVISRLLNRT